MTWTPSNTSSSFWESFMATVTGWFPENIASASWAAAENTNYTFQPDAFQNDAFQMGGSDWTTTTGTSGGWVRL